MHTIFFLPKAKTVATIFLSGALMVTDLTSVGGVMFAGAGVLVAAVIGYFTIRNLQQSYWRNLVDERDAEIIDLKRVIDEGLQERAAFADSQREVRHQLKTQIATLEGRLQVEHAKHDLTSVTARMEAMEKVLEDRQPMFEAMAVGVQQQTETLEAILAELRNR